MNIKDVLRKIYKYRPVKKMRRLCLFSAVFVFMLIVIVLPYSFAMMLGSIIGFWMAYILPGYRKRVIANLGDAFPDMKPSAIVKLAEKVFCYMGMNVIEFALISFRTKKFWLDKIEMVGKEHLDKILDSHCSVIIVSGHIGNWELLGAYLSMIGYPVSVVAKKSFDKKLNWLLGKLRLANRVNPIERTGTVNLKKMIKVLRNKTVLGILIDLDTKVGGIFVDFFKKPAYTPTAVSQFARLGNIKVVPGFIFRQENMKHKIIIMPEVDAGKDEKKETQEYTRIIETVIREHPEQWIWMQDRWKSIPA